MKRRKLLFLFLLFLNFALAQNFISQTNTSNYNIPDGSSTSNAGTAYSSVTFSGLPAGSTITNVSYETTVYHTYHDDLAARLSTNFNGTSNPSTVLYTAGSQGNFTGYLDKDGSTGIFNGMSPNQTFYFRVWDTYPGDTGYIDYFKITIEYATPQPPPTVNSVTPSNAVLGNQITFAIQGSNLNNDLVYFIQDFGSGSVNNSSSTTYKTFSATSSYNTGIKNGEIKDDYGGNVLYTFQVNVYFPIPSGLNANAQSDAQININWSSVSNTYRYQLYRATSLNGSYSQIYNGTSTSYSDTGLNPNTTYYYKVKACQASNPNSCSNLSNATSATTLSGNAPPYDPTIYPFPSGTVVYINEPITVNVATGNDPNGDQTKVHLTADDSNRTDSNPYISPWGNGSQTHNVSVTFSSLGTKRIYATTFDVHGSASNTVERLVTVEENTTCNYTDTSSSDWWYDAVQDLCQRGLLDDDGTVEPTLDLNRAELAKLAYLSINLQNNPIADVFPSPYMDLQDESIWYHSYAKNLLYLEYGDGTAPFDRDKFNFYPSAPISRAHILKVLLEAWNIDESNHSNSNPFSDVSTSHDAYDYIIKAKDLGVIQTSSNFRPNDNVLRAEAFVMLHRMLTVLSLPIPTINTNDFYASGNYTPYNFSNFDELHSGNFNFYTESSFDISSIGIPLNFAHTYNSYATDITSDLYPIKPLGFGWSHTYNSYIVETADQYTGSPSAYNAVVHLPNGEFNVFDHTSAGNFNAITEGVYSTLQKNSSTYQLQTKDQYTYTYEKFTGTPPDFPYVLTSIKDRNNNTLNIQYGLADGSSGYYRVSKIVGTAGRELNFSYYPNSDLIKNVTDPLGRSIEFDYDGYQFSYNDQPDLTKYVNPKGGNTFYNYGNTALDRHMLLNVTLPKGNTITNTYTKKKLTSTQTNGDQPTQYQYQENYGQTANNNYTETIVVNPNSNETTTIQYTKNGNANYINKDDISITNITYHPTQKNLPTSITTNGVNTSFTYDNNGNTLSVTRPLGVSYQYSYTSLNDVLTYTDPEQNIYTNSYDSSGNLESVATPRGTTDFNINSQGLVTSISNPEGITTNFSYNNYGDVVSTNAPEGISTGATFDSAGRIQTFTNPNGDTTSYTFDNNDNLTNEVFNNRTVAYSFDPNNNLTQIVNARGHATNMTYDFDGDTLSEVDFQGMEDKYTYLDDGRIATRTKPDNTVFTYNYNNTNGRLESLSGGGQTVSFTYDARNNIQTVTNENGTINYNYDLLDRITSTIDYYGNTVAYEYDLNSNVTKIIYPDNKQVNYTYYDDNLLHTVTDWNNQTTTYTYRNDGLLLSTTYPNGSYETMTYDNAGRPIGLSWKKNDGTVINQYSFTLNAIGWHTSETKTEPITTVNIPEETISYSHNSRNQLVSQDSDSFSYDTNGNTSSGTGINYTWDAFDRLTGITGSFNASYEYDGSDNRRESTVNGNTKRYVLDVLGLSKVLVETDNNNTPQNYYVYGLGLISRTDASNNTRYYHYDYRGSTIAMTDENETITHSYKYDDFGKVLQANEADFNPYRYVGKYGIQYENENLAFMRARYYTPDTGRFLTEDPIWATNLYIYAENNPVNSFDPKGTSNIFIDAYNASTNAGDASAFMYAKKYLNAETWYEKGLYGTAGLFASLWTPKSAPKTAITLTAALALKGVAAKYTGHAVKRMIQHRVSPITINKTIQSGARFLDPKNNSVVFVLEKSFSNGKGLLVATKSGTNIIKTVIKGTRLIRSRFIPF